ncbi:MAG: c-type cytochrome [Planctomycetes bacterium]|nr:c-type cytochrome [Planctomycetota bacterium]
MAQDPAPPLLLEQQLQAENLDSLTSDIRTKGDPVRGAILFYQPYLTCTKCHPGAAEAPKTLGPDLAQFDPKPDLRHIVESLLAPSRVIRKGYESVAVTTHDGKTLSGILVSQDGAQLVLRDADQDGKTVTLTRQEIEEVNRLKTSLMPVGLTNLLADRQQFLDLAAYVHEIATQGPGRALELKPLPALYALPPIPEYESHIDHRRLLGGRNDEGLARGEAIYKRVCANCHGTIDRVGSLPTSLRFATGKFKNGFDPYAMYQTLTRGYGMMVPQTWMVPQQKYDVIHYIREAYLKPHNPSQYAKVDESYLNKLPKGDTLGPQPSNLVPWIAMDYGPSLINTYEIGNKGQNFAFKGIALRLDAGPGGISRGHNWLVFDHDTFQMAATWSARPESNEPPFIDWAGIHFDGQHQVHPHISGQVAIANPNGPGWADPQTGRWEDPRPLARDGRPFGPLPRAWAHYRGLYAFGNQTVISYTVGETPVLELAAQVSLPQSLNVPVTTRTLQLGPRPRPLQLLVATDSRPAAKWQAQRLKLADQSAEVVTSIATTTNANSPDQGTLTAGCVPEIPGVRWDVTAPAGRLILQIPAGDQPLTFSVWHTLLKDQNQLADVTASARLSLNAAVPFDRLLRGGPRRWPEILKTRASVMPGAGPFAVDVLTPPLDNPWFAQLRFTGHDFFDDGDSLAACTWDGDVWLVRGLKGLPHAEAPTPDPNTPGPELSWQRIASGLFQPLGLKIVGGKIHLTCRDQLVILHDLNGDGETDYYQNLNNDHQVTEHFHEFAMGLQTDSEGNFYYAKSARHALPALVPHHGTLLRVARDGSKTEILANGFRAANGVCLNPDGSFIVTDQEGHWNPKNRINRVVPGGFYGNMFGYHDRTDTSDSAMEQPVCWITNRFDRSPAELLWVTSDRWGPLKGSLLNLSYGYGKVYVVPLEDIHGQGQGGMVELPLAAFPTGIMRGRFHPQDGQLYVCGMFAWAGNATQPGGLYRIRYTGQPVYVPLKIHARTGGVDLAFSGPLDRDAATDFRRLAVRVWDLKRTQNYGSDHYNEHPLPVTAATLSEDGLTLSLKIPELQPTWCMEIKYSLRSATGTPVNGVIHNTIHQLDD